MVMQSAAPNSLKALRQVKFLSVFEKSANTMVDATRALLDELMGKERNLLPTERQNVGSHFSDPEVCKHFLCGFCPHQLFINTKSDLGTFAFIYLTQLGNCNKIHDDLLKAEYVIDSS